MRTSRSRLGNWWEIYIGHRLRRRVERVWMWVAWHLPKALVRWCYVRVGAHATTGKYGNTTVPDLTMMDALERWEDE